MVLFSTLLDGRPLATPGVVSLLLLSSGVHTLELLVGDHRLLDGVRFVVKGAGSGWPAQDTAEEEAGVRQGAPTVPSLPLDPP